MPELKNRMLFISHAWHYEEHYETLVDWFDSTPNFAWRNCSIPSSNGLPDKTQKGLAAGITRQMSPAQGVIIIAGMYAAHSGWIDYELDEALRMQKKIIAIRPRGAERMPLKIQATAARMVSWNRQSIVDAIREEV